MFVEYELDVPQLRNGAAKYDRKDDESACVRVSGVALW